MSCAVFDSIGYNRLEWVGGDEMVWFLFSIAAGAAGYFVGDYCYGSNELGFVSGHDIQGSVEIRLLLAVVGFFVGGWLYTALGRIAKWRRGRRPKAGDDANDIDGGLKQPLFEIEARLATDSGISDKGWSFRFMWWGDSKPRKIKSNLLLYYKAPDMTIVGSVGQLKEEIEEVYKDQLSRRGDFFVAVLDKRGKVLHGNNDLPALHP